MIPALKSEFRKLLTVRSTYFIVIIALLIVSLFAGYIDGFRGEVGQHANLIRSESANAIVFVGFILAFAGMLLVGHEYRYNTIMYTLASSNRRYKVLLAKLITISIFALAASLVVVVFAPLCTIAGGALHGRSFGLGSIDWGLVGRCLFCGWGYAVYAFIFIAIIRSQVGAIVTFLLLPLIGENILSLLLKHNAKYLPFNAVQSVAAPMGLGNHTTATQSILTVLAYISVGLIISVVLFLRRDAN
ncbi:MAG TPA: ABC transporter permease [Candidatus Saccharimonadales bacterium]|nr:ABC transporter permease [Candidatus Saccharimonadales bacterium]